MRKVQNIVLWVYLIIMFGYFPLYYRKGYAGMGDGKYHVFLYSSIVCFGCLLVLFFINYLISLFRNKEKIFSGKRLNLSRLDMTVIVYFGIVMISFLFSDFKQEALTGADGWCMGLLTQIIFFLSYFFVSREFKWNKHIITILLSSGSLVFLLGILHRFYIDPLSMYVDLNESYRLQFLSTIGQSSWYSSFVCTVFPIGLFLFYSSRQKKQRIWLGIYCFLGFSTIVTQNTDSAFLAMTAVFFLLFYLSRDGYEDGKRFWECTVLMLGSFKFMGLLQFIFKDHSIRLDSFSMQMSQGWFTTVLFILAAAYYIIFYYMKSGQQNAVTAKYPFYVLAILAGVGVIGMVIFITLNSTGFLYDKFGYCNENNYLLFCDSWGNNRGFTWRFTLFSFKNMTVIQKLVGVGPDCYKAYNYNIPEYADVLHGFWGNLNLTNAHNEYLTMMINYGIFGLISYITMLITGIITFLRARKIDFLTACFALCLISYSAHNFFCYQQVCCTPFLYLFMGLGMNRIRNEAIPEIIKKKK